MDTRCHLMFDEYGAENCFIILIENYPCNSKEELFRKEGEYMKAIECVNRQIAGRTIEEHFKENADRIRAWQNTQETTISRKPRDVQTKGQTVSRRA